MTNAQIPRVAAIALVIGAVFGMAGTFVPSAAARSVLWGLDGTALTAGAALLAVHHFRSNNDVAAAGFLVFAIGEGLIVSGTAMELAESAPAFAGGTALWAASMALVSASRVMPPVVRLAGSIGSLLFAAVAVQIFMGRPLTPLSEPLPFFAYPFLAVTLFGWAWVHYRASIP